MGRASDWLREERRKTLGDWVAFCLECGHVQRYFAELEAELPSTCPGCGGELRSRCPACAARIPNAFAVGCEECEAELRPAEAFGVPIRKPARPSGSRRSG
jgi:predicted nucleic acid-binding Zn ribbon protein